MSTRADIGVGISLHDDMPKGRMIGMRDGGWGYLAAEGKRYSNEKSYNYGPVYLFISSFF